MFFVTSFVGQPPSYWVDCLLQIRLFTNDKVYCITDHPHDQVINRLQAFQNVEIVPYISVIDPEFQKISNENKQKFSVVHGLHGREQLFLRSIERFFLCANLMKHKELKDVFFLELDNMIYEDPNHFIDAFRSKHLAYMFDNVGRSSSGIMYVREPRSLDVFCKELLDFVAVSKEFLTEMTFLYQYEKRHPDDVQYLPVHPDKSGVPVEASSNSSTYNGVLFDAASLGVYLYGNDTFHTKGKVITKVRNKWSFLDFTRYKFSFEFDAQRRRIPYITIENRKYKIFNLHIHSKQLRNALSKSTL